MVSIYWNLHLPASTLGFFNLFWFGHAPPPLPDHTTDFPGPKVFLVFFGFLDWNLHIPASTLGFFNLFWFGHAQPPLPDHTSDSPGPKVFFCVFVVFSTGIFTFSIDPRFFEFVSVWTCPATPSRPYLRLP